MPKSFSRLKHEESKPNSELYVRSQKENGAENRRNWVNVKFRRLRIFVICFLLCPV